MAKYETGTDLDVPCYFQLKQNHPLLTSHIVLGYLQCNFMTLFHCFYRIIFDNNEQCVKWLHRLSSVIVSPSSIEDLFSFAFYAWTLDSKTNDGCYAGIDECNGLCLTGNLYFYWFYEKN
jgi:hypothetical protein